MKKFSTLEEDLIKENAENQQKLNSYYDSCIKKLEQIKISLDNLKNGQIGENAIMQDSFQLFTKIDRDLFDILGDLGNDNSSYIYTPKTEQPINV